MRTQKKGVGMIAFYTFDIQLPSSLSNPLDVWLFYNKYGNFRTKHWDLPFFAPLSYLHTAYTERHKTYILPLGNVGSHLLSGENSVNEFHASASSVGCPKHEQEFLLSRVRNPHPLFLEGNTGTLQSWARSVNPKWKQVLNFLSVKKHDPSHSSLTSILCWLRDLFHLSDFVNPIF